MDWIQRKIADCQKRISSHDKQLWERSVEQRLLNRLDEVPREPVGGDSYKQVLIDIDLVRGSAFPKAKVEYSFSAVTWMGCKHAVFLPLYFTWWKEHVGLHGVLGLNLLYICQLVSIIVYFFDTGEYISPEIVPLTEIISPVLLLLVLGNLYAYIMCSRSHATASRDKRKHQATRSLVTDKFSAMSALSNATSSEARRSDINSSSESETEDKQDTAHSASGEDESHTEPVRPRVRRTSGRQRAAAARHVAGCRSARHKLAARAVVASRASLSSSNDDVKGGPEGVVNGDMKRVRSEYTNRVSEPVVIVGEINGREHGVEEVDDGTEEVRGEAVREEVCAMSEEAQRKVNQVECSGEVISCARNGDTTVDTASADYVIPTVDCVTANTTGELVEDAFNDEQCPRLPGSTNGVMIATPYVKVVTSESSTIQHPSSSEQLDWQKAMGLRRRLPPVNDVTSVQMREETSRVPSLEPADVVSGHGCFCEKHEEHALADNTESALYHGVKDLNGERVNTGLGDNYTNTQMTERRYRASVAGPSRLAGYRPSTSLPVSDRLSARCYSLPGGLRRRRVVPPVESDEEDCASFNSPRTEVSEMEFEDHMHTDVDSSDSSCSDSSVRSNTAASRPTPATSSAVPADHPDDELLYWATHGSSGCAAPHKDKVSCVIWEGGVMKKVYLSPFDIGWVIIQRSEHIPEKSDYVAVGVFMALVFSLTPTLFRWFMLDRRERVDYYSLHGLIQLGHELVAPSLRTSYVIVNGFVQRLVLSGMIFFLLTVAERTFKQRLLYAKHFCYLTSSRRARKYDCPHFRLNKVRNIRAWLSLRSYLKKRGPQRSVDVIVSTVFLLCVTLMSIMSLHVLQDSGHFLEQLYNCEVLVWCFALGVFLLRYMSLGVKVNRKFRNMSILLTEQINLYLQMEQKPHKKEELLLANAVLKLAEELLKEIESPFKISGLQANPFLMNILKVIILSAFSAVATDVVGFKLKLYKIKLKA